MVLVFFMFAIVIFIVIPIYVLTHYIIPPIVSVYNFTVHTEASLVPSVILIMGFILLCGVIISNYHWFKTTLIERKGKTYEKYKNNKVKLTLTCCGELTLNFIKSELILWIAMVIHGEFLGDTSWLEFQYLVLLTISIILWGVILTTLLYKWYKLLR